MNRLSAIDEFSKESNLSKDLRLKIRHFVKSTSEFEGFKWTDQRNIFFELPKNLRYEIALSMHQGSAKFLNFFKYRNSTFISSVVPFLSHVIVLKDAYVYKTGEYADEIFFLLRGKVEVKAEINEEEITLVSLLPGCCFGDIEVVKQSNRNYSIKCCAKSSLLIMNYDLLEYIKSNFQAVWHDLVVQAYESDRIFTVLKENIQEVKEFSKGEHIKNLKDMNEFINKRISKRFFEEENWNLGKDLLTDEEISALNIENIKKKVVNIKTTGNLINDSLDQIIEQLKSGSEGSQSSVEHTPSSKSLIKCGNGVPIFAFDNN